MTHDAIVLDLSDLKRQADAILRDAREEAQRIVEQGRLEARKLTNAADARGHAQGLERGRVEGHDAGRAEATQAVLNELAPQIASLIEKWTAAIDQWNASRVELLMQAQEDVLAFACALGARVVHRMVETDPLIIRDQLAEALSLLARPTSAVVRVNPDDRAVLELALPDILRGLGNSPEIALRDDTTVARGGCIVATNGGQINATIEKQLQRIVESLLPLRSAANPLRRVDRSGENGQAT